MFLIVAWSLSSTGGNLTFEIPTGVADDHFVVDPIRGIVTTRGAFDRESKDMYTVPIYVKESSFSSAKMKTSISPKMATTWQFDVATIVVRVTDVNDHAPEFRPGSCYPLRVPENSDLAVIHTVVATDMDEGLNGDIIYSITGMCLIHLTIPQYHLTWAPDTEAQNPRHSLGQKATKVFE